MIKKFFDIIRKTRIFYLTCLILRNLLPKLEKTFSISICKFAWFIGKFNLYIDRDKRITLYNFGYEIENKLFWYGLKGYEPLTISYWLKFAVSSEVIIEVGANTGVFFC